MTPGGIFRPGMRGYFVPLAAGLVLSLSAFLPWVVVDGVPHSGYPDTVALWVVGLGAAAALLAFLSLLTRRNSRHPLLLVGLVALGIMFLSWRLMPRMAAERALTMSQALAIVGTRPEGVTPVTETGFGIFVGLAASTVLVCFGLTIVIRRASTAYVIVNPDDDVE